MLVTSEVSGERVLDRAAVAWDSPKDVLNLRDTPMLLAVVPWGDAVFNEFQCTHQLPREIEYLRTRLGSDRHVAMLDELERLRHLVATTTHAYLWFQGD